MPTPTDDRELRTSGSDQRPARSLTGPALAFDLSVELATLQQEHVTEGQLRVSVGGSDVDVPAGSVLVLARGERHAVEALEDSAFLLTVAALEPSA